MNSWRSENLTGKLEGLRRANFMVISDPGSNAIRFMYVNCTYEPLLAAATVEQQNKIA